MKGIYTRILAFMVVLGISFSVFGQVGTAQNIIYDLNYSDPASDVTWTFENGTSEMKSEPKDVNIKWVRSEMQPGNETLKLTIELSSPGQIRSDNATFYHINIYTTTANASHFIVNYSNTNCILGTNISTSGVNNSVDFSIVSGELHCFVNKSELGNITYYNIDASAQTREYQNDTVGWVLKRDFGWEVPGNPGTTPDDIPEDTGTPGFELWTIAVATVFAMGIITVSRRRGT